MVGATSGFVLGCLFAIPTAGISIFAGTAAGAVGGALGGGAVGGAAGAVLRARLPAAMRELLCVSW